MNRLVLLILFLLFATDVTAQILKGLVVDGVSGQPIVAASVYNANTGKYAYTDSRGEFSISAYSGDAISFSFVGYKTQQKTVPASMGVAEMYIELFQLTYELDEFTFRRRFSPYQLDSMERKSTYQRALARPKITSIMSPVTLIADKFSRKSKHIYNFQKSFNYWEDLKYVESRYTPELVAELTPLRGDTVAAFINAYPLPFDFARVATDLELKMWIREQYKAWQQNPQYLPPIPVDSIRTTK